MSSARLITLLAALLLAGCALVSSTPPESGVISVPGATAAVPAVTAPVEDRLDGLGVTDMPPPEPREFRAAWVATVANIDWPSAPGLPQAQQRSEAVAMIERAAAIGLNALVLQVRPSGDAIYPSALEPWTEYLTGAQGRAPDPPWDPLAFWVQEAHRRGLELHVWLNPYRARAGPAKTPQVAPHLAVVRPDLVKRYGDLLWMDPGEPDAANHTLAVVADVVRRYAVDGVHIDDYFYPYPISQDGVEQAFPDDESFARYKLGGGPLARDDWRRANVDDLVRRMHDTVHQIKPWVRFGVSPFGVGKPERRPAGVIGFSQYDKLYADVERWFENGWLDYLAPQLYWQIQREGLQFPVLLDYWLAQNRAQRHVWPGLFTSLITKGEPGTVLGPRAWLAREVLDQVEIQRSRSAGTAALVAGASPSGSIGSFGSTGHIHFSMVALMQNRDGIATLLQFGPYAQAALVPASPWLDSSPPPAPRLVKQDGTAARRVFIQAGWGEAAARWAVWRRAGGQWKLAILPGNTRQLEMGAADALVVSAVDAVGNLSPRSALRWPAP